MKIIILFLFVCAAAVQTSAQSTATSASASKVSGLYSFTMKDIDGKDKPLSSYKGKVLLLVNTASKCGYTPQYLPLEKLYETYRDKGFVVLAFPANDFHEQEPGTNAEIKRFCSVKYDVMFDLFSKISVKGTDMHPLYAWLTAQNGVSGDITWNFNKFLIGRDGVPVARFDSKTEPLDPVLTQKVEALLAK